MQTNKPKKVKPITSFFKVTAAVSPSSFCAAGVKSLLLLRASEKFSMAVTKISSCRVNTTSRRAIKQLGISFGSFFLLFSNDSSLGNPRHPAPNDNPGKEFPLGYEQCIIKGCLVFLS